MVRSRTSRLSAAIGVDLAGHKDILGVWPGAGGGESAKFWLHVLTELRNRGVTDVFFIVCDGLKGLPDGVNTAFPQAIVQTCIIHLIAEHVPLRLTEVLGPDQPDPASVGRGNCATKVAVTPPGQFAPSARSGC